jgi:hypothetical protein
MSPPLTSTRILQHASTTLQMSSTNHLPSRYKAPDQPLAPEEWNDLLQKGRELYRLMNSSHDESLRSRLSTLKHLRKHNWTDDDNIIEEETPRDRNRLWKFYRDHQFDTNQYDWRMLHAVCKFPNVNADEADWVSRCLRSDLRACHRSHARLLCLEAERSHLRHVNARSN